MTLLASIGPWQSILIAIMVVLPIIAIVDIFRNKFKGRGKIAWLAVVFLTNGIGAIIYLLFGRSQRLNK